MKICYVGIYPPKAPRDKVYIDGLKKRGHVFIECVSQEKGLRKYINIVKKLKSARNNYDFVWVGYLSGALVPLVYLFATKRILFNALGSSYEAYILDRQLAQKFSFISIVIWFVDYLSLHLAKIVLVESLQQKKYLASKFFVKQKKLEVVYTGVDERVFYQDAAVNKREIFTVVFRGLFIPATGVRMVLQAALLLRNEDIDFLIIGWGDEQYEYTSFVARNNLKKVRFVTTFQKPDELRTQMLQSHVMLGQFSKHPRLDRTIQHKTSEAMALGLPYVTRVSKSNKEILRDRYNCLFVEPENPESIKNAILELKNDTKLSSSLSKNARRTFESLLSGNVLVSRVEDIISTWNLFD
jgi:glycosyltransferase involved in cell wall biosynthesis